MGSFLQRVLLAIAALLALPAAASGAGSPPSADGAAPHVEQRAFRSEAMGRDIPFHLYLPEAYKSDPARRFPVVYWLHGSGGFPPGVIRMLAGRFDAAIAEGRIPPLLVVFPDGLGESMWVDSKDGRLPMERIFVRELVPHVDATLRTVATARGRLLEGGSMGGYGAARLGLKYPELFGAVSMINAGPMQEVLEPRNAPSAGEARARATLDRVYGGDPDYFRANSPWVLAEGTEEAARKRLRFRQIVGGEDPVLDANRRFSRHLSALGIPHDYRVLPGVGHSPAAVFPALGEWYWSFFAEAFQQPTPADPSASRP
ncbi:alpha/beta hydrolase [Luteimonas vadosa]|uniref:Alpha/beta hydrolase-fold protein n=1 Tax=Luteimonas vadosa TaxID=1165507 RepID=A0ABP9DRB7_9GAMM